MKVIESEWKEFCLSCFGNISEQQYVDLRRTFYGGAASLFFVFMNLLDPGTEPTEGDLDRVTALQKELESFNEEVKAGRA
jgi:hypothetical protein